MQALGLGKAENSHEMNYISLTLNEQNKEIGAIFRSH
jgi:hypothetical protein